MLNMLSRFVIASLHGYSLVVVKGLVYVSEALSHALQGHQGQTGNSGEFGENTGHWWREWRTTAAFLPREPVKSITRLSDLYNRKSWYTKTIGDMETIVSSPPQGSKPSVLACFYNVFKKRITAIPQRVPVIGKDGTLPNLRNKTRYPNWVRKYRKILGQRSSLGLQSRRFCAPSAGGPGSIPCQGTRPHKPQLKIPHAATKIEGPECRKKTWHGQISKQISQRTLHVSSTNGK